VGVYTGGGSSHSWLWLAEVLERLGFYDVAFFDHARIKAHGLKDLDVLALSGGDTFAVAGALGAEGAAALREFLNRGGLYLGFCAGAYLPMNSSQKPLDLFNIVPVKIGNLSRNLPRPLALKDKFCTPYGCSFVFHPVREAVRLEAAQEGPFAGAGIFEAPLYGGPVMKPDGQGQVLARYRGFTEKTRFLADRDLAARTVLGRTAVLRASLGVGRLYLFGPHFEHPHFPAANRLLAQAIYWDLPRQAPEAGTGEASVPAITGAEAKTLLKNLKREISNARIAAWGISHNPARWLIGKKVYEPEKFAVFMEAVWTRLRILERLASLRPGRDAEGLLPQPWAVVSQDLRRLKQDLQNNQDTLELAAKAFTGLNRAAAGFMEMYFRSARPVFAKEGRLRRLH
jgi:hypothetical protein